MRGSPDQSSLRLGPNAHSHVDGLLLPARHAILLPGTGLCHSGPHAQVGRHDVTVSPCPACMLHLAQRGALPSFPARYAVHSQGTTPGARCCICFPARPARPRSKPSSQSQQPNPGSNPKHQPGRAHPIQSPWERSDQRVPRRPNPKTNPRTNPTQKPAQALVFGWLGVWSLARHIPRVWALEFVLLAQ